MYSRLLKSNAHGLEPRFPWWWGAGNPEVYDHNAMRSHRTGARRVMVTDNSMPIWATAIAPHAKDEAVSDCRGGAYESIAT